MKPLLTRKHFKQLATLAQQTAKRASLSTSQLAILTQELGIFCNQYNHRFDYEIFKSIVFGERFPRKVEVKQTALFVRKETP